MLAVGMSSSAHSAGLRTSGPFVVTRLIETATKRASDAVTRDELADPREAARVPVGTVTTYFKTKEELAEDGSSGAWRSFAQTVGVGTRLSSRRRAVRFRG